MALVRINSVRELWGWRIKDCNGWGLPILAGIMTRSKVRGCKKRYGREYRQCEGSRWSPVGDKQGRNNV